MGRPLVLGCALPDCDKVSVSADADRKGVLFDLQDIFERKLKQPSCTQLWACCQEHKLACLSSVLKDMPYLGKNDLVH